MNWLALSPAEIWVFWAGPRAAALWLVPACPASPSTPKVSDVALLGQRPADFAAAPADTSRAVGPGGAGSLLAAPGSAACESAMGQFASEGRSVAIVLDTSFWAQAHPNGANLPWIDRERTEATRLLDFAPALRPCAPTFARRRTPRLFCRFTMDQAALRRAILAAQPSSVAADLPRALEIGRAALGGARRGLLLHVGPGLAIRSKRAASTDFVRKWNPPTTAAASPNFSCVSWRVRRLQQNRGITRLSLRRDAAQPDRWRSLT